MKEKRQAGKRLALIRCELHSALNLVGTQASRTDVNMARSTVNNRLHTLDIGLPHPVGTSVGVGHLDPKRNTLAANIALSHWLHLLATENFRITLKHAVDILPDFNAKCNRFLQDFCPNFSGCSVAK